MCTTHYNRWYNQRRIERGFTGNADNRDRFVAVMESMVKQLKPKRLIYVAYIQSGQGYASPDVNHWLQMIAFMKSCLRPDEYNWVIRQINEGLDEGNRIPLWRQEYGNAFGEESHGQQTRTTGGTEDQPEAAAAAARKHR